MSDELKAAAERYQRGQASSQTQKMLCDWAVAELRKATSEQLAVQAAQTHGCHDCGEERPARIVLKDKPMIDKPKLTEEFIKANINPIVGYLVHSGRGAEKIGLPDSADWEYLREGTARIVALLEGNWQKLGATVTAGEARERFRGWLKGHCNQSSDEQIADKAAEIFCSVSPEERSREDSQAIVQRVLAGAAKMAGEPDQIAGLKSELKDALHECESRGAILDGAKEATGATWWMGIAEWANLVFAACKRADSNPDYCSKITPALVPAYIGQLAKERDHANRMYQTAADTGADQITTLKQTISRLEGEVADYQAELGSVVGEVAATQKLLKGWIDAAAAWRVWAFAELSDVSGSLDDNSDDELRHKLSVVLSELADLPPQPEVIEGRGQAVRLALCQAAENLADIGESLVSLSQSLRESPPRKPAFVAPEKPEQVLIRTQRGELYWATKADGDWWLAVGGGWHRNVKPIDPVTGEPIAKEEA